MGQLLVLGSGEVIKFVEKMPAPQEVKRKAVLIVKAERGVSIDKNNINQVLCFMEITKSILEHMLLTLQEVYLPILLNPGNQGGWSDLVSKDLIDSKLHTFLANIYVTIGEIRGRTLLPLPPFQDSPDRVSSKDRAHVLEGAIIMWTKQIKNVLKQDPEAALKSGQDPDPLVEIQFWLNKAENLNSIHQQLQSEKIKKVLKFLEANKSTYTNQFQKLMKEVQQARLEANDNYRFLQTLEPLFKELTSTGTAFSDLPDLFIPIMHTILLIWNNSQYYNTPARLVVLIREICNAIISQACLYINGKMIFEMITANEAPQACDMLSLTLDVCSKFKDAYFDYKAKANNTWKITTNALFVRLDSFSERCQDIQHLTQTIVQFSKLQKIEIGGTKGKTLTTSVKQIWTEFDQAVTQFQGVQYDIMDVSAKEFDDDFYEFRCRIKELERRLASVLTQGFDDCDTIYGRLKLLDSFEGLLNRPIIQDELEKKHITLLESYKADLKTVQHIFLEGRPLVDRLEEKAPIAKNQPPITGALNWARGLMERIKEPIEKLSNLNAALVDREEYKDVQKLHSSLMKSLKEYETNKNAEWEKEVEKNVKAKLQQFLLVKDEKDQMLKVNFDPALVRILREVKYLLLNDLPVPKTAQDIYANVEVYRNQTGNLDLIVNMYNNIVMSLLPVELPLLQERIQKMDATLKEGFVDLRWNSQRKINDFIHASMVQVKEVNAIVNTMKDNLRSIEKIMAEWAEKPLIERKQKPMAPDDFESAHKASVQARHQKIQAGGKDILKLLKDTGDTLKVAKISTHWKAYVDFVNGIVIEGLANVINVSNKFLSDQIDPVLIKKHEMVPPIFDIKVDLFDQKVMFEPEIESTSKNNGIRDMVNGWISDFVAISTLVQRIDNVNIQAGQPQRGDYLNEIKDHMEVQVHLSIISQHMDAIELETNRFKQSFQEYSYLWSENLEEVFEEFLNSEDSVPKIVNAEGVTEVDEEAMERLDYIYTNVFQGCARKIPNLEHFNEKISQLKAIQQKIAMVNTPTDIGWLRVNASPLKGALDYRVNKWINTYTGFLLTNVQRSLERLNQFMDKVKKGIRADKELTEDQYRSILMEVMNHIRDVRTVESFCDGMFGPLKEQVQLLKRHQVSMEGNDYLTDIENARTYWEETKNKVNQVKATILPLQAEETKNIRGRLDQFSKEVDKFRNEFLKTCPFSFEETSQEVINNAYQIIDEMHQGLIQMDSKAKQYNNLEGLFELEKTNYKQLKDCWNELKNLKILWDAISIVHFNYDDWKVTLWDKINTENLLIENKKLEAMVKNLKKEIRVWKGHEILTAKVKNMGTVLPLINDLHSEFMERRHWKTLMQITSQNIKHQDPSFCFDDLLKLKLYRYAEEVQEIVSNAQKEANIEKKLRNIENYWEGLELAFNIYKDCNLIQTNDEMMEMLDKHSMDLMSMGSQGKTVEYFKDRVTRWLKVLRTVDSTLGIWLKLQKNWERLETIFLMSEDIRSQLPDDTKRFEQIDGDFRELMNEVAESPGVVDCTTVEGRDDSLQVLFQGIEQCEKSLTDYLEQKKKMFPRFYFVSNQALLNILSNSQNPFKVAEYLKDLFDSLSELKWMKNNKDEFIPKGTSMYSKEKEEVDFAAPFEAVGAVETWLNNLEDTMRKNLHIKLVQAKNTSDMWEMGDQGDHPRDKWLHLYAAQISLLVTQIVWTEEVTRALEDMESGSDSAMKDYLKVMEDRIKKLIQQVIQEGVTKQQRTKIITIITIDVHAKDVVEKFAITKLADTQAFAWQSQLKFTWEGSEEAKECWAKICDWRQLYSYEYVGNCGRLVITPLTDRCYITLTQALNLTMGGAPAGPAGTGKTETTKDLGRALGIPVMVFNCSEQMNSSSMAQIFMGLSQTGAWGCFDEFNRISIEVLSVVSTQVKTILDALKKREVKFFFTQDDEINLRYTVGFFITMNPGYAGRTELPENLKALFRSCAMVVPDLLLICENMLMSEGFTKARHLSRKFITLYKLCEELLSKQMHYDWKLRAIKSVLRMAGKLRRDDPEIDEEPLLMRALRDFNLPKIVTDDIPIFKGLILDLFPGIDCPPKWNEQLFKKLKQVAKKIGLQPEDQFVKKAINLVEIMEVRHSVFIIGNTGCGKTAVWNALAKVEEAETIFETIDPKAVTSDELFGANNIKTKEWKDGVLSVIMRDMSKNQGRFKVSHTNKWVVLDGDIDPEWIESLNTVMDDNKVLTLVSNERIPLTDAMRMLFEISNLRNATPATVSRAGVLYINDADVGWKPYMDSWLEKIDNDEMAKSQFYLCFSQYFEPNLEEFRKYKPIAPIVDISYVSTVCCILQSLIKRKEHIESIKNIQREEDQKQVYEAYFIFAVMWAIGGSIADEKQMQSFSHWWRSVNKGIRFPEGGHVYDYFFDPTKNNWIPWSEKVPKYTQINDVLYQNIIVPNIDITRQKFILNLHVLGKKPSLFVGSAGTGKTTVVKDFLSNIDPEFLMSANINFNSYTDSLTLQKIIESHVKKLSGKIYGPPANKQLIFFIDDLNMPYVDKYGTQTPICLIRQLIDYGSMFDRDHLEEKKSLVDCQFMACMNQKAGSFLVDSRLQRHFTVFSCPTPTNEMLFQIYTAILGGHLASFDQSIQKLNDKAIQASIDLFKMIIDNPEFAPSTKKFHYQFNMRDISRIVQGLLLAQPNLYKGNPVKFIRLWVHECNRVFFDRLINEKDMEIFKDYLIKACKNFEEDQDEIFVEPNIFTSFISAHGGNDKAYLPIKDMPQLKKVLEEKLHEHNETNAVMNLVLFDMAMEHVSKIARIIDQPAGNALLVGVGGSGKQSLSRLSSFILAYDVIQILVSQTYSLADLKADIQQMYIKAGVKGGGTPSVFILTDTQIPEDKFLVDINDLLSSGVIPGLFASDELENIFNSIRNEAKQAGKAENNDLLFEFFIDKVRMNLHVILCFSPVGDAFRIRARKFPAIISSTSVDWFHPWPRDALFDVASRFLQDIELDSEELKLNIANHMADVHVSIDVANDQFLRSERRFNYTTPKSFLELIDFYKVLLRQKRDKITTNIQRLQQGLETLSTTGAKVNGLKLDLEVKMIEVEKQRKETDALIEKVSKNSNIAEEEQKVANAQEAECSTATEEANKLKAQADSELAEAMPAMIRAREAVSGLDKKALSELKALPKPPDAVLLVTKAVLLMRGEKRNFDWKNATKMLNNPAKFLEELENYDKNNIDDWIVDQLKPIIDQPVFNYKEMQSKSFAAACLCQWVCAVVEYNGIYKKVKPLMNSLEEATKTVEKFEAELVVVRAKVAQSNEIVNALKRELGEAMNVKEKVEAEANACLEKLQLAQRLVEGLSDENKRWGENVIVFKQELITSIGDALISAAFVSYIGPFSSRLRNQLWNDTWLPDIKGKDIPSTEGVDPMKVIASDTNIALWRNEGLPADRMSIENASIIVSCARWPLIIDPQLQGSKWIRGRYGEELETVQTSADKWLKKVENCIVNGKTLMIENLGSEIDAILDPVLSRSIYKKSKTQLCINLGGEEIDYDNNFKLFLQTKLSNPHYRPETAAQCTIINFIVTELGLEDQLLAMVVNTEKQELEQVKQELVRKQNEFVATLSQLEADLLERLSAADPNTILSNTELIKSLENTKATAKDIGEQAAVAKKTEIQINQAREIYRRVATEGAMLYFLIIALCIVDHMYQYSLESFITFFFKAIDKTPQENDVEARVINLREIIRMTIYQWVSRGLFEKHKQIFLVQITLRLMQKSVIDIVYDQKQVEFLMRCPLKTDVENPLIEWLPNSAWFAVQKLIEIEGFENFASNMEKEAPTRFKDWYMEAQPEDIKLPLEWKKLDSMPLQKLLVMRCLRPDRLTVALNWFIKEALKPFGKNYVDMDQGLSFTDILANVLQDATAVTPIFFILSPGTNPVADVEKIGKREGKEKDKNYHNVSLGQGMDVFANQKLDLAHKEGHWVMLQNIHLMPKWCQSLEKRLDTFALEGSNINFRLFLTAEPSNNIPIGILERSIKLTNEPPAGLKANLKRAFTYFSREEVDDKMETKVKCILFGLCFFHSLVIERRKFGPKGWNLSYPFSMGDLGDSAIVLNNYLEMNQASGKIPWDDLRYIFGEIMYGGHIVDDRDRLLASTYLTVLMTDQLFDEGEMFPFYDKPDGFRAPPPVTYERYLEYIDVAMRDTPLAFGMHPNAEIGYMTNQSEFLFKILQELQPRDATSEEEGAVKDKQSIATDIVQQIMDDMNLESLIFDMEDIDGKLPQEKDPFQNIFMQEIELMNFLIKIIVQSCKELHLAFNGELTMTEEMEQIQDYLVINKVPQKWQKRAYPSTRGLGSWLHNLIARIEQLKTWTENPDNVPKITNISRLFNPQSFLTAIKQITARNQGKPLNQLIIFTDVKKQQIEEIDVAPREGAYVTGLHLEGARWDVQNQMIDESKPREMFSTLPVIHCKAQLEGKEEKNVFYCPVYKTEARGATYVFSAQLRSPRYAPAKWILAGAALIMDVEGVGDVKK